MNRSTYSLLAGGVVALGVALPAAAHHSFAAIYNMDQQVTVHGAIAQVKLTNPHSWVYLDVKNEKGEIERWAFEAGTPSGMIRNGFKPNTVKTGDEVTITAFHARDAAQNMGMLKELKTADGTTYGLFGPQEQREAR
jgi:uncharacterized protein DUF6152